MKPIKEQQANSPVKEITILDHSRLIVYARNESGYQELMHFVETYRRSAPLMWKLRDKINFSINMADPQQRSLLIVGNIDGFVYILHLNNLISDATKTVAQSIITNSTASSISCTLL